MRRIKQLQARNDKGRILTQASQAGDGSARIEEGQGGPAGIVIDGDGDTSAPLVRLYLLLIIV